MEKQLTKIHQKIEINYIKTICPDAIIIVDDKIIHNPEHGKVISKKFVKKS